MSQRSNQVAAKNAGDIKSFKRISQIRFNFAKEFYTKVFAYKLAFELREVQRKLQEQYKSLSPQNLRETNNLIRLLSLLALGSSRKGFSGGYNIIYKPIRIFSPKSFAYQNISLKSAEKFIRNHKTVVSIERLKKIKPRMIASIEKNSVSKKVLSGIVPRGDYSFLKKAISATSDALRDEAKRLSNLILIHHVGGDVIEVKELAAKLESVKNEIKKRDLKKKKDSII